MGADRTQKSSSSLYDPLHKRHHDTAVSGLTPSNLAPVFPPSSPIHRKALCACGGGCPNCQAKSSDLKVSQPNDAAEIEADHIADQVMRAPLPSTLAAGQIPPGIQRSAEASTGAGAAGVGNIIPGAGIPLQTTLRQNMEYRFGQNFSGVRMHTGSRAAESARALDAAAYTVGRHIVFGEGRFDPASTVGQKLIAHELTHVVQQTGPYGIRPGRSVAVATVRGAALQIHREQLMIDGEQVLPRVKVRRHPKNTGQLLLDYGDDVVATLDVKGKAADVDAIRVNDRTGSNRVQKIDTIDIDVVYPPGVTVTLKISRPSLAKTKKRFGIFGIKMNPIEAKPPYKTDRELQLWPPGPDLGTMRQRRPLTRDEQAEEERTDAIENSRKVAMYRKMYKTYMDVLKQSEQSLEDLHDVGIANYISKSLPPATVWNEAHNELFLALRALDYQYAGLARVHLRNADAALRAANGQVSAAMKNMLENVKTGEDVTIKVGTVSRLVGETAASLIPGPVGKVLSLLYKVTQPPPTIDVEAALRRGDLDAAIAGMEERADRLQGLGPTGGAPSIKAGAGKAKRLSGYKKNYAESMVEKIQKANPSIPRKEVEEAVFEHLKEVNIHHMITQALLKRTRLGIAARKAGYNAHQPSNLKGLMKHPNLIKKGEAGKEVGHWGGAHKKYTDMVEEEMKKIENSLLNQGRKTLEDVPKQEILKEMDRLEKMLFDKLEKGDVIMKDGNLAVITPEEDAEDDTALG